MNDQSIKQFMTRLYRCRIYCDTKAARSTLNALMKAHQAYYSQSNAGNGPAARDAWLNVRTLSHEVNNLYLGGVIELTEGVQ